MPCSSCVPVLLMRSYTVLLPATYMHSGLVLICAVVWYGQDPDHPRAGMKEELKAWCQHHHCEALAQLAVFGPAREALKRDASVVPALEAVAAAGLSAEIREVAAAALMALSDKELEIKAEGQKHVMLSCASIALAAHCFLLHNDS